LVGSCKHCNETSDSIKKARNFLTSLVTICSM
jgi:hypothetical protein